MTYVAGLKAAGSTRAPLTRARVLRRDLAQLLLVVKRHARHARARGVVKVRHLEGEQGEV